MATNNSVNTGLALQTGTGKFVGDTAPTISNPQINQINDTNGNPALAIEVDSNPVNYLVIAPGPTGTAASFSGTGSDTDVGIIFAGKGTGAFEFISNNLTTPVTFLNGTLAQHSTAFAFANTAQTRTVTWPDADGTVAFTSSTISWSGISGTTQAAAVNSGYIVQNASQTTITLPATAAIGSVVSIRGLGAAGWKLTANSGQTIKYVSATTTTAGSLTSAEQYDTVDVTCIVADTTWAVSSAATTGLTVS